jgi:hypothetical protein
MYINPWRPREKNHASGTGPSRGKINAIGKPRDIVVPKGRLNVAPVFQRRD